MPRSERSLRRLVAELSEASAEDVEDVLAQLEAAQRSRVEALLREFAGAPVTLHPAPATHAEAAEVADAAPSISLEGLSPWLIERFEAAASGKVSDRARALSMTSAARESLRAAVLKLQPPPAPAEEPLARPPAGWRARLAQTLRMERA